MDDDAALLQRYAEQGSEAAFAELVRRHLGLVYRAALRQLDGDTARAQDVAQEVFISLARKARALARRPVLAGWLHTSTRYAVLQVRRTERRRKNREQAAFVMNEALADDGGVAEWERLQPLVDDALHSLGERDREAVLLRFFENRPFAEIGARLAVSEDAARVRVDRALGKLRDRLARHVVSSTSAALAVALANQVNAAVPAGLVATVTGKAVVAGSTSALMLIFMNLPSIKTGLALGAVAVGMATMVVQYHENQRLHGELAALHSDKNPNLGDKNENARLRKRVEQLERQQRDDTTLIQLMGEESALKTQALDGLNKRIVAGTETMATLTERLAELTAYELKDLDRKPVPSARPQPPSYPAAMMKAGIEGSAVMEFVIDDTGAVRDVHAYRSTHKEFEAAAAAAVRQWKYAPGEKDGRPVYTRVRQTLEFKAASPKPSPEKS